jgi:hypothetical protein
MISIAVNGLDELDRALRKIPAQARLAASRALNDTAKITQDYTVNTLLPESFTLRSRGAVWWQPGNKFGFNIGFANPSTLEARVGSQADWLRLHEDGGEKEIEGHNLAIPSPVWKPKPQLMAADKKPRNIIEATVEMRVANARTKGELRKAKKAMRVLQATPGPKAFIPMKDGQPMAMRGGVTGIFKPNGRGHLELLFAFKKSARIGADLQFYNHAKVVVDANYLDRFNQRLEEMFGQLDLELMSTSA